MSEAASNAQVFCLQGVVPSDCRLPDDLIHHTCHRNSAPRRRFAKMCQAQQVSQDGKGNIGRNIRDRASKVVRIDGFEVTLRKKPASQSFLHEGLHGVVRRSHVMRWRIIRVSRWNSLGIIEIGACNLLPLIPKSRLRMDTEK